MRSTLFLIVLLIFVAVLGIFVFQNNTPVTLSLFSYSLNLSQGILALIACVLGIFFGIVWFLPRIIHRNILIIRLRKQNAELTQYLSSSELARQEQTQKAESLDRKLSLAEKKEAILEAFLGK
ncbi:MAG: lipopolysaccharide assembly protein LapA domain-containing protein [bacterium]